MSKIGRIEKVEKKVEGYIDQKSNTFIVTKDEHGLLSEKQVIKSYEEIENDYKTIGELLKKYKPKFLG